MPRTRSSGKQHSEFTPYLRLVRNRKATSKKALATAAAGENSRLHNGWLAINAVDTSLRLDGREEPRYREPSFTEWEDLNGAAIIRLTEDLDLANLALHEKETTEISGLWEAESPLDAANEEGPGAQPQQGEQAKTPPTFPSQSSPTPSERQPSLQPGTQAPIAAENSSEDAVLAMESFVEAVVVVETPIEEVFVELEARSNRVTPVESDRENYPEVVEIVMRDFLERADGLQAGEAVPTQAVRGSQDDPIVLDDDDYDHVSNSSRTAARQRQQNQYSGMVQWSSAEYENEIITGFEQKWMEIQTHWMKMNDMRSQIEDPQILILLDQFDDSLEEVYEDGSLAQGSASFLLEEWNAFEIRTEGCWADTSVALFRRSMTRFGGRLRDFADMEPLYDAIVDYRGTASDEE
ncbi:hypothetical protein BDV96DRAFT_655897 [Lophiotrema nucula]|uniref:Uncharacterized protein n=1 Tax=Lophiotrema nucula TaxID=690887 RepID=A0A6A5YG49_9PLEO|nr:hypothetical protein BDV96DRAFT_655897 [Lophiotrema nucula]